MWGVWGKVIGEKKEWGDCHSWQGQLSYKLYHGTHVQKTGALAWSEDGAFGLLTSQGHWPDTHACPVGGSVVPTRLNRLEPGSSRLQVPEKQLGQISYCLAHIMLGGRASFYKNNYSELDQWRRVTVYNLLSKLEFNGAKWWLVPVSQCIVWYIYILQNDYHHSISYHLRPVS